ncbi:MAG: hypothetical protein U9R00_01765 [Patescibacteria group bacterium]|nr:hypothetical protein [Patescibacteria group bacterium]
MWYLTSNPLGAIILVTLIDLFGYFPTLRKSYSKPHEETATTFFLNGLKFLISLFALQVYTPVTWLYPSGLTLFNFSLAFMI